MMHYRRDDFVRGWETKELERSNISRPLSPTFQLLHTYGVVSGDFQ
jgi:hypothetical protein